MAENPIRKEDIIDGAGISQALKEIINLLQNDLTAALKSVTDAANQYKGAMSSANASTKEGQDVIRNTAEDTQRLNTEKIRIIASQKELEKAERALIRAQREEIEVGKSSEGSYRRLSLELRKLTAQWKDADAATRGRLTPSIKKLDDELRRLDATIGKHQRNVGNYTSAFKGMGKTILSAAGIVGGATMALRAMFKVIGDGFKTTWDFEKEMSQVKAVSGATADEFERLRQSAISLGGSTKFTATEVAKLQTEYAKLGFTAPQIVAVTAATLDLAAATGEDLAASANIAGATLRGFGLDVSKMQMVVDVMAESFNKSALDLNSFSVAMQQIAPVANAVGDSIQQATAKLSVLSNAGLDASISGTSLRNIYMELEQKGLSWDEAMAKINNTSNKATMALDLFGKRGAVAGIILSENSSEADAFTESFNNAAGAAEKMAGIMEDNVAGAITKLDSAWEGLILRINQSSGAIQGFIESLALMVSGIASEGNKNMEELFDEKRINTFNDRFRFFLAMGLGYNKAAKSARVNSNEEVQQLKDEFVRLGKIRAEKEAEIANAANIASTAEKQRRDEELKRIDAQIAAAEEAAKLEKKRQAEILKGEEQRAANLVKHVEESTKDNEMVNVRIGLAKTETQTLIEMGEMRVATEEEIQQKLTEINEKYAGQRHEIAKKELGDALEIVGMGVSAMVDLYSSQKERELSAAGDNAKKREEIERKYFRKQQALSIAQAVINGAQAVTKAQAQTGILSPFIIPLIIAQTVAQIALISAQKFAKGGFTGRGTRRDETGERVAGIVHENEFVIDKKKTKKYRPLLEAIHRDDKLAIAAALNNSTVIWDKTAQVMNRQDPFTEKMYQLMRDTPVSYTDSTGATVLIYPGGRKKVIKRSSSLQYSPSMIR